MFEKFQHKKKTKITVGEPDALPDVSSDTATNDSAKDLAENLANEHVDGPTHEHVIAGADLAEAKLLPLAEKPKADKASSENPEEKIVYACFFVRLWSALMDLWIAYAIAVLVAAPGFILWLNSTLYGYLPDCFGHYREELMLIIGMGSWAIAYIIPLWLYISCFESSRYQATPAKLLFHLRVQDTSGNPFTFWRSTRRLLLQTCLIVVPCALLASFVPKLGVYLCPLFQLFVYGVIFLSRRKQTLYDKICHRVVVAPQAGSSFLQLTKGTAFKAALLSGSMIVTTLVMAVVISAGMTIAFAPAQKFKDAFEKGDLARCQTYVFCDRAVSEGQLIAAEDVRTEVIPTAQGQGVDRIISASQIVGKRAHKNLRLGDPLRFNILSNSEEAAAKDTLIKMVENHTLSKLDEPIGKSDSGYAMSFANHEFAPGHIIERRDLALKPTPPRAPGEFGGYIVGGSVTEPRYLWEVLGKKSDMASPNAEFMTFSDINQSGIGYKPKRALPLGYRLQLSDLEKVQMKSEETPYSTVSDLSLLIGHRLARGVEKGTLLRAQMIDWR